MWTSKIFLLTLASLSKSVVSLNCWVCDNIPKEECLANRVSNKCDSVHVCINSSTTLLNTSSGETTVIVRKGCTVDVVCNFGKEMCDNTNTTTILPMKMTACSFGCCTSGADCVNSTDMTTTAPPQTTTFPVPAYSVSPWATDMSLCKTRCCDSTPSQIWQNRTCCPSKAGGCVGVPLTKEIKCEDTYCNEKHCGAHKVIFTIPCITITIVGLIAIFN